MIDYLRKYILSALLHVYIRSSGVRFYKSSDIPSSALCGVLRIQMVFNYEISFHFHRSNIKYLIYHNRRLVERDSLIYTIDAIYPPEAPERLKKYSSVRLFVKNDGILFHDLDIVAEVLLSTYLKFVEMTLVSQSTPS